MLNALADKCRAVGDHGRRADGLEGLDLFMTAEPSAEHDEAHTLDSLAGRVFVGRRREILVA